MALTNRTLLLMNKYKHLINLISEHLDKLTKFDNCEYSDLLKAERYSITSGGKHLRGLIVLQCAMLNGIDVKKALDFACAVEMVHTYSLIHDDLPDMDNDDLRRGKPTCHKVFGNDIALLAGDALLTKAFNVIARNSDFDDTIKIKAIKSLSDACGEHGMLAGQVIDKKNENKDCTLDIVNLLHDKKTGKMFETSVEIGCLLSGVDYKTQQSLLGYIKLLGLAFQVKDDILDVTSTAETLGKPINSDRKSTKSTYVSILGIEKSKEILNTLVFDAKKHVEDIENQFFVDLADYFVDRSF